MKILLVRLGAIGDIVHSAVVLQYIKKNYPNSNLHWIVEKQNLGILQNSPFLDKIYSVELKKFKKTPNIKEFLAEKRAIKKLGQKENYDIVIDMQGLVKSALLSKQISKKVHGFSYLSIKEGFASLLYSTKSKISYSENTIFRNLQLIEDALNIPEVTGSELFNKQPYLFTNSKIKIDFSILLVIGSTWESRNYPKEKFLEICRAFPNKKFGILWGSESEKFRAEWIVKYSTNSVLSPKVSLDELKSIIQQMELVVGNDTGPTHIAWAMNIPSITIFGPTPISRVFQTPKNLVVKSNTKVNPKKLNKRDFSIRDIDSLEIINKIQYILER